MNALGTLDPKAPSSLDTWYSSQSAVSPLECYMTARNLEKGCQEMDNFELLMPLECARKILYKDDHRVDVRVI